MFERFTDRARRVVVLAQEEARMADRGYIGTEHILLGLIHEGEGMAAVVLREVGVTLDAVRAHAESHRVEGGSPGGHIPFTPRCKRALEYSLRDALQLGHNYIGTEHILLGLLRDEEDIAVRILGELGVDLGLIRKGILDKIIKPAVDESIPTVAYISRRSEPGAFYLDRDTDQAIRRLGNGTRCWKVRIEVECEMEHIPAVAAQLVDPAP